MNVIKKYYKMKAEELKIYFLNEQRIPKHTRLSCRACRCQGCVWGVEAVGHSLRPGCQRGAMEDAGVGQG